MVASVHTNFPSNGTVTPPFKYNTWKPANSVFFIWALGFCCWDAAGEAEAECLLVQRIGVVDVVVTEDTLMFDATRVAREV
jgi:hypothetical protein